MRFGRVALGALVAFAVSVVCLVPPVVHFLSGPIGPLIGGYVAGNWLGLKGTEAGVTGFLMGTGIGATLVLAFQYSSFMPDLAPQASIPLSLIAAVYVGGLGFLGAWFPHRGND